MCRHVIHVGARRRRHRSRARVSAVGDCLTTHARTVSTACSPSHCVRQLHSGVRGQRHEGVSVQVSRGHCPGCSTWMGHEHRGCSILIGSPRHNRHAFNKYIAAVRPRIAVMRIKPSAPAPVRHLRALVLYVPSKHCCCTHAEPPSFVGQDFYCDSGNMDGDWRVNTHIRIFAKHTHGSSTAWLINLLMPSSTCGSSGGGTRKP